jgi:aminopeptidase N
MEKASGRDLSSFVDYWIHGASVPQVKFTFDVDEGEARLRFEQRDPVEVAITVRITYKSGATSDVVVTLADRVTEVAVPVKEAVREMVANADNAALVVVQK